MVGSLLGRAHFGPGNAGRDRPKTFSPTLAKARERSVSLGPLTGPSYSFWIQQTGQPTNYHLGFRHCTSAGNRPRFRSPLLGLSLLAASRF